MSWLPNIDDIEIFVTSTMSQATIMEAAINKKFSMNICLNNAFLSAPKTFRKLYTFPRFIINTK